MLTIQTKPCPDKTHFVVKDVLPSIENGILQIVDGYGTRRSWGAPSVKSTVTELSETVIQVDVVGWHKHTTSPVGGFYYFVLSANGWERKNGGANAVKLAKAQYQYQVAKAA